jgi:hypothetical protein
MDAVKRVWVQLRDSGEYRVAYGAPCLRQGALA